LSSHKLGRDRDQRQLRTELYRSDMNLCMSVSWRITLCRWAASRMKIIHDGISLSAQAAG